MFDNNCRRIFIKTGNNKSLSNANDSLEAN